MSDPIREQVMESFHGRCIYPLSWYDVPGGTIHIIRVCMQPATDVHEIIHKSQTKNWNTFENRIPLCREHHMEYHNKRSIRKEHLTAAREKMLAVFEGR